MNQMIEPCPFCGSEATLFESRQDTLWEIQCSKCMAITGPVFINDGHRQREAVTAAWNTRAYNPDERLREASKVVAIIKQAVTEYEDGPVPKGTVGIWLFLDQWKALLSALSPLPQGDDT